MHSNEEELSAELDKNYAMRCDVVHINQAELRPWTEAKRRDGSVSISHGNVVGVSIQAQERRSDAEESLT